jgi:ankyrin repeat protein
MMADAKPNTLFKAVKQGDSTKVRELLAAGLSIEAVDLNQMTPVMLAAQAGQLDVFRTLVELGANLHALALDQVDLLECAASGGQVEIIRFLLDQGHPIEGHWKPRSPASQRMGRITPLIKAAINGHVEAVRVLLEAGANRDAKYDRRTALSMLKNTIKFPFGEDEVKRLPQLKEIVKLLKAS